MHIILFLLWISCIFIHSSLLLNTDQIDVAGLEFSIFLTLSLYWILTQKKCVMSSFDSVSPVCTISSLPHHHEKKNALGWAHVSDPDSLFKITSQVKEMCFVHDNSLGHNQLQKKTVGGWWQRFGYWGGAVDGEMYGCHCFWRHSSVFCADILYIYKHMGLKANKAL